MSNTGDTALNNVVVTDTAPAATTIVAAPGASLSGNKATWTVNLQPGEKKSLSVKLASKTAGNHCNTVTAAAGGLSSSAEACTVWKGIAAVLLEAVDDPDPIQVGETTTYTIRVTNQGFADINNVKIVYKSGERTQPVSSAQGTVSGKDVNFPTVAKLAAKQVVTYTINVKGIHGRFPQQDRSHLRRVDLAGGGNRKHHGLLNLDNPEAGRSCDLPAFSSRKKHKSIKVLSDAIAVAGLVLAGCSKQDPAPSPETGSKAAGTATTELTKTVEAAKTAGEKASTPRTLSTTSVSSPSACS